MIAVWLIALATHPDKMPRRLVYVVNRRTVVDQTTDEVEKYKANNVRGIPDFALSTLRGQFADNREWSADPSRPAVICGTVDMIGSRLLFSGYGVGMKGRPLHAGFLGQDVLLVHDEAHLEPAFQDLVKAIEKEQREGEKSIPLPWPKFRVMELTATSRGGDAAFPNALEKKKNDADPTVQKRVGARKMVAFTPIDDERKIADDILAALKPFHAKNDAVLVFVRKVDDVQEIAGALGKLKFPVQILTGTLRGLERDRMANPRQPEGCPIFARFLPKPKGDAPESERWVVKPSDGPVFLVCTSAGEVGVNISTDHLVCDLSTFESMAQRFGRVNRFGFRDDTVIHVLNPTEFEDTEYDQRRAKTLELLKRLNGDGSPTALGNLGASERQAAFAPTPTILPATDILFDAWALTTIRKLADRPEVGPYLHGDTDDDFATEFAWREEVGLLTGKAAADKIEELLSEFPLKPHETLRVPTFAKNGAYAQLEAIRERQPSRPAWVIEPNGDVTVYPTLDEVLKKEGKNYAHSLAERTVVLPPKAGGLTANGTLDGKVGHSDGIAYDVAGTPPPKVAPLLRLKAVRRDGETAFEPVASTDGWAADMSCDSLPKSVKPGMRIEISSEKDDDEPGDGVAQYLVVRRVTVRTEKSAPEWPALERHLEGVRGFAEGIVSRLNLDEKIAAVILAAKWHDLGKGRAVWQRGAGNHTAKVPVAKALHGRPPENLNHFWHELGSMVDVVSAADLAEFDALDELYRDVVLHLIATHHGRGRPHFPEDESHDLDRPTVVVGSLVTETPGRFARLQRTFGRWGLAYLESLLRAADILESRRIEAAPLPDEWPHGTPDSKPAPRPLVTKPQPTPSITVAVDPTNPGQFFACCGLLELADRLWPGAEGWFEGRTFRIRTPEASADLAALIETVNRTGLAGQLTPDLQGEREKLEAEKARLRKEKKVLDKKSEARRKELGSFARKGNIVIGGRFNLQLDWWQQESDDNPKTWSGSQQVIRIAEAALLGTVKAFTTTVPFDYSCVMRVASEEQTESEANSGKKRKRSKPVVEDKVAPFYFDNRHGASALPLDIGFSPDKIGMESKAFPAVEFLCLVGVQRCRPRFTGVPLVFEYFPWQHAIPVAVTAAAVVGVFGQPTGYRFENAYRTDRRPGQHSGYLPASPFRR